MFVRQLVFIIGVIAALLVAVNLLTRIPELERLSLHLASEDADWNNNQFLTSNANPTLNSTTSPQNPPTIISQRNKEAPSYALFNFPLATPDHDTAISLSSNGDSIVVKPSFTIHDVGHHGANSENILAQSPNKTNTNHAGNNQQWTGSNDRQDLSQIRPLKRPKRTKGTVYRCGLETQTGRLAHYLLDDYLDDSLLDRETVLPLFTCVSLFQCNTRKCKNENDKYSSDDILVLSAGACCGLRQFFYAKFHWLRDKFPGKVLYLNAESFYGNQTGNNIYMISSQPSSHDRNVQVTFAAMTLIGLLPRDKWPIFTWKDYPRPRNTGKHFLAYVTTNCVKYRQKVALALSQVGVVHHGRCVPTGGTDNNGNNRNFTSIPANFSGGLEWTRNIDLFRNYRFCLVLENKVQASYITEKIVMAFVAGCVPIWYGTTDIWNMFHKDSFLFVNAKKENSIRELVNRVSYLEENQNAYEEIFQHAILANGNTTLEKYFSLDDSVGSGRLKHEIRVMMGLEDRLYQQIIY